MTGDLGFAKMVASGNDFIIIDSRGSGLSASATPLAKIAKTLCERKLSIGADGTLFIEDSVKADFKMRIFNPDGSEAQMCGNGSRCVALYAVENKIAQKEMKIETKAGILDAEVIGLKVKIRLTDPKAIKLNRKIKAGKRQYTIHTVNTGVPHAVCFVKKLERIDVEGIGSMLRRHRAFKPAGANVDFVEPVNKKTIRIRTYERGVEAETYACGTGAAASAIISSLVCGLRPHIDVETKSKETLRVYFDIKGNTVKNIYLEGEARLVYRGGIDHV